VIHRGRSYEGGSSNICTWGKNHDGNLDKDKTNTVMMDQKEGPRGELVRKGLVPGCGTEGMIKGAGLP
jgi:hypothetical protein